MDQISASKMNYQPVTTTTGETVYVEPSVAKGLAGAKLTPDMLSALGIDRDGNGIKDMITSSDYAKLPAGVDLDKLQNTLEQFISGAKDRTALFAALIEMMNNQRQSAVDQRANARESAKDELLSAAGKNMEAAQKQMDGAIGGLVMGLLSGAAQIGMGSVSLKVQVTSARATAGVTDSTMLNKASTDLQGKLQTISAFGGAAKDTFTSSGQTIQGSYQADSSNLQAKGQEIQAIAQDTQTQQDMEKKFSEDLTEAIKAIVQFIKEVRNAEIERMASITRA